MAEAVHSLSEQFQPIPVRLDSTLRSRIAFAIRRFADLRKAQRALSGGGAVPEHLTSAFAAIEEAAP